MNLKERTYLQNKIDSVVNDLSMLLSLRESSNLLSFSVGGSYAKRELSFVQDVDIIVLFRSIEGETESFLKEFYMKLSAKKCGDYPLLIPFLDDALVEVKSRHEDDSTEIKWHIKFGDYFLPSRNKKYSINLHIIPPLTVDGFSFFANLEKALFINLVHTFNCIHGERLPDLVSVDITPTDIAYRCNTHHKRIQDYCRELIENKDVLLNKISKEITKELLSLALLYGVITSDVQIALNLVQSNFSPQVLMKINYLVTKKFDQLWPEDVELDEITNTSTWLSSEILTLIKDQSLDMPDLKTVA